MRARSILTALLFALASVRESIADTTNVTPKMPEYLEQSFFFEWSGLGPPPQIVEQCDTLPIKWERGSATGPDPVAPYTIQIYTSAFVVPLIVDAGSGQNYDLPIPFVPNTQFQICMFDKEGNTGGCQRPMSVYPPAVPNPTCRNFTYPQPEQVLKVDVTDSKANPLSQYGWPAQCSNISVLPTSGTPPYRFTVAPSLHPPWNFTLDSMTSFNWTVALSWGSMFYLSLADSAGNIWSNGPLHSGQGDTWCLSNITASGSNSNSGNKENQVSTYVAVGSGIGGLVGGLIIGLLGALLVHRFRGSDGAQLLRQESIDSGLATVAPYTAVPHTPYRDDTDPHGNLNMQGPGPLNTLRSNSSYKMEPFVPPNAQPAAPVSPPGSTVGASNDGPSSASGSQGVARPNVYVVHHDGGRAPVTVYTDDGAEVVELPPMYQTGASASSNANASASAGAAGQRPFQPQRRQPGATRKPGEHRIENDNNPGPGSPT